MYEDEVDSPVQYIEQISWIIFLRYLDNLEKEKEEQFLLQGKHYSPIIKDQFQWRNWAVPRNEVGEIDHNNCITGEDLTAFINDELFPYLSSFSNGDFPAESLEYQIGVFFSDRKNLINSGYKMRDILEQADDLSFNSQEEKDEITFLFESNLKDMGNAGRSGGKYYTPRPLIQAMIEIINPQFGEKIYDPALGSAGFLCESYTYLKDKVSNTNEMELLQKHMLFGKEKSRLSYSLGVMNMILHGIESPNVIRTNTLEENIRDIQEKDRFDIILANPPFGGSEDMEVRQNFKYQTGETSTLFFQHFLKSLKQNGRAAIIIKNTFLTNDDQATVAVRKELLESCNLEIILDLPQKIFQAGVRTVVLFFKKGAPTKSIWYYHLDPGRNLGKTNPINNKDFKEFLSLQDSKPETERSWKLSIDTVNTETYNLVVSNPNLPEEAPLRSPKELLEEMKSLDKENQLIFDEIEKLL
jgi:type I restriction enzyme M protein